MKTLKWIFITFAAGLSILYLYLSNDELFYSEYWLQRKIINTEQERTELTLSERHLSYRFIHDKKIDITIDLADNGVVQLVYGNWISGDVVMNKELEYQLDPKTYEQLRRRFRDNWNYSVTKEADYKFGGTYHELFLKEPGNKTININYYNMIPSDTLSEFKHELIELAYQVLDQE